MMKYGSPEWKKNVVMTNHPDLGSANLSHVQNMLKGFKDDELKQLAAGHPCKPVVVLAHYALNDRGVEGY